MKESALQEESQGAEALSVSTEMLSQRPGCEAHFEHKPGKAVALGTEPLNGKMQPTARGLVRSHQRFEGGEPHVVVGLYNVEPAPAFS